MLSEENREIRGFPFVNGLEAAILNEMNGRARSAFAAKLVEKRKFYDFPRGIGWKGIAQESVTENKPTKKPEPKGKDAYLSDVLSMINYSRVQEKISAWEYIESMYFDDLSPARESNSRDRIPRCNLKRFYTWKEWFGSRGRKKRNKKRNFHIDPRIN